MLWQKPSYPYRPDTPLLHLSDKDTWTLDDAYMGTFICGGTGSGKSSGSGRTLAHAFLKAGFGGLVLCAKPDEASVWRRYCQETGRGNSLMVLGGNSPHRFNFLEYELARIDGGNSKTPFALEALLKTYEAMMAADGVKADESFWRNSVRLLLSHSIDSLYGAYGRLRFPELMDFIHSAPRSEEEFNSAEWRQKSFHYQTLERAAKHPARPVNGQDFAAVLRYFLGFCELDRKTKSNIIATLEAMVMDFQKGDLARIFCTDTTIVPELSHCGAVIVLDFPLKEWQRGGQIAQQIFKFAWQRAIERRKVEETTRPCFLWADEYQLFASSYDAEFQSTARSSRACTVYMTQSIPALRDAVRSTLPTETVDALLTNFQTTIIHTCKDKTTQEWAADLIGKGIQWRYTESQGVSEGRNWGMSEGTNRGWSYGESSNQSYGSSRQGGGSHTSSNAAVPGNSSASSSWGWGTSRQDSQGKSFTTSGGSNRSVNQGANTGRNEGISRAETMDYYVQPSFFGTALRMGGERNQFMVDGIIMQGGRIWEFSQASWLLCAFPQK